MGKKPLFGVKPKQKEGARKGGGTSAVIGGERRRRRGFRKAIVKIHPQATFPPTLPVLAPARLERQFSLQQFALAMRRERAKKKERRRERGLGVSG